MCKGCGFISLHIFKNFEINADFNIAALFKASGNYFWSVFEELLFHLKEHFYECGNVQVSPGNKKPLESGMGGDPG